MSIFLLLMSFHLFLSLLLTTCVSVLMSVKHYSLKQYEASNDDNIMLKRILHLPLVDWEYLYSM